MKLGSEKHRPFSFRRIFAIAGIASLGLVYLVLWLEVISDPRQRTAADFLPFYAAGRIARSEGIAKVYDLESLRRAENEVLDETIIQYYAGKGIRISSIDMGPELTAAEVNPFSHPPFIVPMLGLLAGLDYIPAYILWSILMGCLALAGVTMLTRSVPQAQGRHKWVLLGGTFLFFPTFFSLINGQDSAVLLLGAAIWFRELLRGRDRTSGLGLGLAVIRPHMMLMLAPAFFFKRRGVWWWFCVSAGTLALVSLFLLGRAGVETYLYNLLHSADARGFKFVDDAFHIDLTGVFSRNFPAMDISLNHLVTWSIYPIAIVCLGAVWARSGEIAEKHIGLAVIFTIVFTPHVNYHDLALLLLPLYGILRILLNRKILKLETAVLAPLGLSLILFISYLLIPIFKYAVLYPIMLAMLALLWFPEKVLFRRG
jgi:hypothetical protein